MSRVWTNILLRAAAAGCVALAGVATSYAHGCISSCDPPQECLIRLGPDQMAFTAYQPVKSREQYCSEIPDTGATVVALDAREDELREMLIDVRIIRNVGQKDDRISLELHTEIYLPPKVSRTGTVYFEHNFREAGHYVIIVGARSRDGAKDYRGRLAFQVGEDNLLQRFAAWSSQQRLWASIGALGPVLAGASLSRLLSDRRRHVVVDRAAPPAWRLPQREILRQHAARRRLQTARRRLARNDADRL